jgi:nitrogen regulatory protein PII
MEKGFSMILTIVNRGYSDEVMNAARSAGAKGGTVINGKGTAKLETNVFFGNEIHPEKEIVMIIAENSMRHQIMLSINKAAGLETSGSGFSFSLPVEEIVGSAALIKEE